MRFIVCEAIPISNPDFVKKSTKGSPTFAFIIMATANFLAMIVFGLLYLVFTDEQGERNILLLVAAGISLFAGIAMLFLYAYFHKKLHGS